MKFYKKMALVGLSALTILSLSACGATNQSSQPTKHQQQVQKDNDGSQNGQQNNSNNTENDHDGASQSEIKKSHKLTKEDSQYVKDIDVNGPQIVVKLKPNVRKTFVQAEKDLNNDRKNDNIGKPTNNPGVKEYPMNNTDKQATSICAKLRKDIEKKVSNDSQISFTGMLSHQEYDDTYFHGILANDFGYGNTTQSVQNQP